MGSIYLSEAFYQCSSTQYFSISPSLENPVIDRVMENFNETVYDKLDEIWNGSSWRFSFSTSERSMEAKIDRSAPKEHLSYTNSSQSSSFSSQSEENVTKNVVTLNQALGEIHEKKMKDWEATWRGTFSKIALYVVNVFRSLCSYDPLAFHPIKIRCQQVYSSCSSSSSSSSCYHETDSHSPFASSSWQRC